jgi:hypothetical protein
MAKYRISRYWKTYKNPVTNKEEVGNGSYFDELIGGDSDYVIEKKTLVTTLFGSNGSWEPVGFEHYKCLHSAKMELLRILEKERAKKREKSAKKHRETVCEYEV